MKTEHGHVLLDALVMTGDQVSKWKVVNNRTHLGFHVKTAGGTTRNGVLKFIPTNDFSITDPTDVDALAVPQLIIAAGTAYNQVIEIPDFCAGGIAAWYDHGLNGAAGETITVTIVEKQ